MRPAPPAPAKKTVSPEQPLATPQGQQDGQNLAAQVASAGGNWLSTTSDKASSETVGVGTVQPTIDDNRPLNLSKEDRFGTQTSISQYLELDLDFTEDELNAAGEGNTHSHSNSDATLMMLHDNSTSLPEFPSLQASDRDLSSPEGGGGRQQTSPGSEGQGDGGGGTVPDGGTLTGGGVGKEKGQKKRWNKRGGSVKGRSRSPPNLPPPPPPAPLSDPLERRPSPVPAEKLQSPLLSTFPLCITNLPPPPPFYPPSPSKDKPSDSLPSLPVVSLPAGKHLDELSDHLSGGVDQPILSGGVDQPILRGSVDQPNLRGSVNRPNLRGVNSVTSMEFVDVMNTISNIEQQLNELECQSPIRGSSKESEATFRPIPAGPNDNLTSPELSDSGQDLGSLQGGGDLHYDHFHGNNDKSHLLYDHLCNNGIGEGSGSTHESLPPLQSANFAAFGDPPSSLKTKAPPIREGLDAAGLRSSVEVSCSDEEELFNKNLSPKKAVSKVITKRIFFPEESSSLAGQAMPPLPPKDLTPKVENRDFPPPQKPSNKRNQKVVTFKAEVMDLTAGTSEPSEPHHHQASTAPFVLQAVPTTTTTTTTTSGVAEPTGSPPKIANIKKMLFGENELATHRYRKDSNTTAMEPWAERQGTLVGGGDETQKTNNNSNCNNLYEVPWEMKPVAKYTPKVRKYENVHLAAVAAERQSSRGILCRPTRISAVGVGGGEGEQTVNLQPPEASPQASLVPVNPSERKCNGGELPSPPPVSALSISSPSSTDAGGISVAGKVQNLPSLQGGQSGSHQNSITHQWNGSPNSVPHASIKAPGKIGFTTAAKGGGVQSQSSPRAQHSSVQKFPKDSTGRKVELALPDSNKIVSVSHATPLVQPVQSNYVYRSLV